MRLSVGSRQLSDSGRVAIENAVMSVTRSAPEGMAAKEEGTAAIGRTDEGSEEKVEMWKLQVQ